MEQLLATALGQDVNTLAAQERQLLLSRLVARFAHEIRNPLSSLGIHVQLLEEDLAGAAASIRGRTAGRLEIIRGELHRLETVVRHFLSLARPSSLNRQPVVVSRLAAHVGELLRPEAATRGIELAVRTAEDVPVVAADEVQLTQALVNLVVNALQALNREGRVEIRTRFDREAGMILLEVADSGPGVPEERRSAIFEPFYTTKPGGSGLGLWIVQQIVTAHGGRISVVNADAGGAVFTLLLPVTPT